MSRSASRMMAWPAVHFPAWRHSGHCGACEARQSPYNETRLDRPALTMRPRSLESSERPIETHV